MIFRSASTFREKYLVSRKPIYDVQHKTEQIKPVMNLYKRLNSFGTPLAQNTTPNADLEKGLKEMFKITKTEEDERTVNLRIDGKLVEDWQSEFERLYLRIGRGRRIILDLSGVSFIDDSGIDFIEKMKDERIDIVNCSPFIESLLGDLVNRDRTTK